MSISALECFSPPSRRPTQINIHMDIRILSVIWLCTFLSACGSETDNNSEDTILTGVFIDSFVAGLDYKTQTIAGLTNQKGEFNYRPGETVQFSIGSVGLGETIASPVVTILDINNPPTALIDNTDFNGVSYPQEMLDEMNLLFTLDVDQNPENGIQIDRSVNPQKFNYFESQIELISMNNPERDISAAEVLGVLASGSKIEVASFGIDYLSDHFKNSLTLLKNEVYADLDRIESMQLVESQDVQYQLAQTYAAELFLSEAIYEDDCESYPITSQINTEWERVDLENNAVSGFKAGLYKSKISGRYVIAFGGTGAGINNCGEEHEDLWYRLINDTELHADVATDLRLLDSTGINPISPEASSFVSDAIQRALADESSVTFTGHSLGGSIARWAAIVYDRPAVTFNSAPLPFTVADSQLTLRDTASIETTAGKSRFVFSNTSNLVNIVSKDDPMTLFNKAIKLYETQPDFLLKATADTLYTLKSVITEVPESFSLEHADIGKTYVVTDGSGHTLLPLLDWSQSLIKDKDLDGLPDDFELSVGLLSDSYDTDGDGIFDGIEIGDPNNPIDTDSDGIIDAIDPMNDDSCLPIIENDACILSTEINRPEGLRVVDSKELLALQWSSVADATGYEVLVGNGPRNTVTPIIYTSETTSITISEVDVGETYYVSVRAVAENATSEDSEIVLVNIIDKPTSENTELNLIASSNEFINSSSSFGSSPIYVDESQNGRYVLFYVRDRNDDNVSVRNLYLHDVKTGDRKLVFYDAKNAHAARISGDGSRVVFQARADQIYLWDHSDESTTLISHAYNDAASAANGVALSAVIDFDGSDIYYGYAAATTLSTATDLVAETPTFLYNLYHYNVSQNKTSLINNSRDGDSREGNLTPDHITPDGRYVFYKYSVPQIVIMGMRYDSVTDEAIQVSFGGSIAGSSFDGNNVLANIAAFQVTGRARLYNVSGSSFVDIWNGSRYSGSIGISDDGRYSLVQTYTEIADIVPSNGFYSGYYLYDSRLGVTYESILGVDVLSISGDGETVIYKVSTPDSHSLYSTSRREIFGN